MLLRDPTGLSTSLSDVEADPLVRTRGKQVGERRHSDATHRLGRFGLQQLGRVSGKGDFAVLPRRDGAIYGDVKWKARARGILGTCTRDDEELRHVPSSDDSLSRTCVPLQFHCAP